ncbi:MAG: metallophosphoesterase, partial [Sphingomonas sp.]|nr:metallophosphoesterase [Sphingomonas sp.]
YNPFRRFFAPYRRFGRIEDALERPINLPNVWLVPLRTTSRAQWRLNWAFGKVSASSLGAAESRLASKPPGALAIIACHHPLVDRADIQARAKTRGGCDAIERLAAAGADAVLSGHVHDAFDAELAVVGRTIRMIGAGTLSERVRATPPSFNLLTIDQGRLTVSPRTLPYET